MGKFILLIIATVVIWHDGFMYGYNWERLVEACHRHKELSELIGGKKTMDADYKMCAEYIETWNNRWLEI